jgi:hypothetical protein
MNALVLPIEKGTTIKEAGDGSCLQVANRLIKAVSKAL